jgi:hypothetical protein
MFNALRLIGVQIQSAARQEVQPEPTLQRLHLGGNDLGAIRGMIIAHQKHGSPAKRLERLEAYR